MRKFLCLNGYDEFGDTLSVFLGDWVKELASLNIFESGIYYFLTTQVKWTDVGLNILCEKVL